jgi:hypothetical protein
MSFHYGPKIVRDHLQLCLDAGDPNSYPGSGGTWYDLSGNGYNATVGANVTYSSTIFGGSLQTLNNATNSNQTIASNSFGNVYWNNFTFEIWFSNDGSQWSDPSGFGFKNAAGITSYGARYNGTIQNWVNATLHTTTAPVSSSTTPTQLVYTGNSAVFTSYINTSQYNTGTTTASNAGPVMTAYTMNNNGSTSSNNGWNGRYCICRFYSKVLSQAEINQNYNALKTRFQKN